MFENPTRLTAHEVFVNYTGFRLYATTPALEPAPDRDQAARFWHQLLTINPESFLAHGDNLILVTRNARLFQCARQADFEATRIDE